MKPWERYQQTQPAEGLKPWERYQRLAEESVDTGESIMPPAQPAPEPVEDIGRTVLEQGMQGATFGFGDEVSDRIGAGIAALATGEGYEDLLGEARQMRQGRSTRQIKQDPWTAIASNIAGSLLTGGAGATTRGGTALAKSLATGGLPVRIAKGATAAAASGGLYGAGQAQEGERLEGAQEGAIGGALIGGALPAVGTAVRGAILPKIEGAAQALAQRAKQFNIPLSMDQVAPSKFRKTVKKVSQQIPFSGVDAFEDTQTKAFTKAVARTIGQETDNLSPAVMKNFKRDAEKKFGDVLIGVDIKSTADDVVKLNNIYKEAESSLGSDLLSIVKKNIDSTIKDIDATDLKGVKLTSMRSSLLNKTQKAQGEAKQFIGDIVDVVEDIAERNAPASKVSKLREARREWRNYKTIEPLLEKSTDGTINPVLLSNRVAASKYIKASEADIGSDDLVDLGRIGKELLVKSGGSDTFEKTALGAGLVGAAFNPQTGALLAGTAAANRLMQELARLQPRVAQAVAKGGRRFLPKSLIPALLAGQAGAKTTAKSEQTE